MRMGDALFQTCEPGPMRRRSSMLKLIMAGPVAHFPIVQQTQKAIRGDDANRGGFDDAGRFAPDLCNKKALYDQRAF